MKNILGFSLLLCILLVSCKSQDTSKSASSTDGTSLVGPKWVLTKLNGDLVNLESAELEQPYIKLTEKDNAVGGNGGCNGFGGTYTLTDTQTISFSQMLSTMRHCEDQGIEGVFIGNIQKATAYTLVNKELTFRDENGYVLATFEPASKKSKK